MIRFDLDYPPSINHYYVRTKSGVAIGPRGKKYRSDAILMLHRFKNHFTRDARVSLTINVFPPDKRRRDLDNILKCCLDSLQHAKVFDDDNQVDMLTVIRREPIKHGKLSLWVCECS